MKNNWEIKTLREVCEFRRGLTYSKKDEASLSKNAILRANNITLAANTLNFDDIRYISDDVIIPQEKKLVKGSVMICTASGSRSHLGKVAFIDKDYDYAFGGFMGLLVPNSEIIDPKYFFVILTSGQFRDHINSLTSGANINNLKFSQIKDYQVTVPPLLEQKRIVGILDEKFKAIEELKKVTEAQIQDAKELFESRHNEIFEPNPDIKNIKTFGEVCKIEGGSQPAKSFFINEPKKDYTRLIQVRDYRTDKFVTYIPKIKARRFCSKTDIMIGRYGPPIFGIFNGLEGAYNVALMKAVPDETVLDKNYFFWFLKNKKLHTFVEKSSQRAAGQSGVRKELLYQYPVPVPEITIQKKVVRELDMLSKKTNELEQVFQKKITSLEELKKSYLEQAFAGKL